MSNILLIGDYFPSLSYRTMVNNMIAESLNQQNHSVYLLSSAWCTVNEGNFVGDIDELSEARPFTKKYFIDPIQMACTGRNIISGYIGILCKILNNHPIDFIFVTEKIEYSYLVELIRNRFNIPCFLTLYMKDDLYYSPYDNYLSPFIKQSINMYCSILTFGTYRMVISEYTKTSIIETAPYSNCISIVDYENEKKEIHIICYFDDISITNRSIDRIKSNFLGYKKVIYIYEKLVPNLQKEFEESPDIVVKAIKTFSDIMIIPKGSMVIDIMDIINESELCIYYTWLYYGYMPLLNINILNKMKKTFEIDAIEIDNKFFGIREMRLENHMTFIDIISDYKIMIGS